MRVLIAGAHGKTARRLARMLVEDGHEVRGLVRKEEQTGDVEADGAEPVLVDLEAEEVEGGVGERRQGMRRRRLRRRGRAGERGRAQGDDGLRRCRQARRGRGGAAGRAAT